MPDVFIPLLLVIGALDALLLRANWGATVVERRQRVNMEWQWATWRAEKVRRQQVEGK